MKATLDDYISINFIGASSIHIDDAKHGSRQNYRTRNINGEQEKWIARFWRRWFHQYQL